MGAEELRILYYNNLESALPTMILGIPIHPRTGGYGMIGCKVLVPSAVKNTELL
jgi:hypothetical protein